MFLDYAFRSINITKGRCFKLFCNRDYNFMPCKVTKVTLFYSFFSPCAFWFATTKGRSFCHVQACQPLVFCKGSVWFI